MDALALHPDRLLPADPGTRDIARRLYAEVRRLPIISPHGHVPAQWIADDIPFADPTSLLVTPDHYITRLLHAGGVPLEALGVGGGDLTEEQARRAWRLFCTHWPAFRGTPSRFWMESELAEIFGVTVRPSSQTADAIYDAIAARLSTPEYRPRALLKTFRISVLATTDDPCDDLPHHSVIRDDPDVATRVLPDLPPGRLPRTGAQRTGPSWSRPLGRPPTPTPRPTTVSSPRWRTAGGTSSSTGPSRPTTATPTSSR